MTKAERLAKQYLDGEPVSLIDMIPELIEQIRILSMDRKGWKRYCHNLQKAIDYHYKIEARIRIKTPSYANRAKKGWKTRRANLINQDAESGATADVEHITPSTWETPKQ